MPLGGCKRPFYPADLFAVVLLEGLVALLNGEHQASHSG